MSASTYTRVEISTTKSRKRISSDGFVQHVQESMTTTISWSSSLRIISVQPLVFSIARSSMEIVYQSPWINLWLRQMEKGRSEQSGQRRTLTSQTWFVWREAHGFCRRFRSLKVWLCEALSGDTDLYLSFLLQWVFPHLQRFKEYRLHAWGPCSSFT